MNCAHFELLSVIISFIEVVPFVRLTRTLISSAPWHRSFFINFWHIFCDKEPPNNHWIMEIKTRSSVCSSFCFFVYEKRSKLLLSNWKMVLNIIIYNNFHFLFEFTAFGIIYSFNLFHRFYSRGTLWFLTNYLIIASCSACQRTKKIR